jgi:hypothetical protein
MCLYEFLNPMTHLLEENIHDDLIHDKYPQFDKIGNLCMHCVHLSLNIY